MLDLFDITGIVHFGIAGNTNISLSIGDGMTLEQCVNSTLCLPEKPKVGLGLRGSTANIFVDSAAYSDFLFLTFNVSSVDMESSAVAMTSLSNGFWVIVIRGLSDVAARQSGQNVVDKFGALNLAVKLITNIPIFKQNPFLNN
ncbi:bark storage protein A-like [Melia azedarach]|uniref:Bark storage protein A-like n=1 Tax=Melia azedarach TaxID=155640 RepID=A0ACC1YBS9_MELAZ|nr:bark storage protein A-like [Melia azedarach]